MTGDDFRDRYQILTRLTQGDTSTFLARAANGDRVMVHVLETPPEETRDLLARVARLTGSRDRRVREVVRHRGVDVVVTDYLDDFDSLDEWLLAAGDEPGAEGAGEATQEADPAEAGEFTRLFQQPSPGGGAGEEEDEDDGEARAPDRGDDRAPGRDDDDDDGSGGPRETPEPEDDVAAAPAEGEEPGEFTRLFELEGEGEPQAGDDPDAEPDRSRDDVASRPPAGPGGGQAPSDRAEEPDERDEIEPREREEGSAPGEFTRMFGAASPEDRESDGGDAGDGTPDEERRRPRSRGASPPAEEERSPGPDEDPIGGRGGEDEETAGTSPEDEGRSGPGEFTRMFGSPDSPSEDRPSDSPLSAGPRDGSRSRGGSGGSDDYLERLGRGESSDAGAGDLGRKPDAGSPGAGSAGGGSGDDAGGSDGPGRYTRMMEQPSSGGDETGEGSAGSPPGGGLGLGGGGASASGRGGGTSAPADAGDSSEDSRTVYIAALGGILLLAVVLVVVLVLAGGGSDTPEGPSPESGGAEETETSALPRQHHQELELRIREVGGNVHGQVPRPADGGPVFT